MEHNRLLTIMFKVLLMIDFFLLIFLVQASSSSSALFLTAAAQNLLCLNLAESVGVEIPNRWVSWLKGACIPALLTLLASPYIVYKLYPPETKKTIDAPSMAKRRLEQMGPMKTSEWLMVVIMLVTVSLWIAGEHIKVASVIAAMLGLSLLLLLGVLTWEDCLSEKSAWDTLAWFGVLVGMATQLNTLGVIPWLSKSVGDGLNSRSISWPGSFAILQLSYFFIHYLFASQTAHVSALYTAFLKMQIEAKVPGVLAALGLAYNTNLFGALAHYSSGQAAVYFGAGYVELPHVFKLGIVVAVFNIIVWMLSGAAWFKIVGIY
ncbi:hypothetical protein Leryth_013949 [Lithospermum erythrorhizon]|uniref:Primary active transporter n=1 Tax=Lithospermum erythrorhizon TaxID=34254 RepID=A0AAV3P2G7_LITER|nr:hypothetical protein Leryth_013949 [Lithospermum erythrorhizon]